MTPDTKPSRLERAWAWLHQTFPERQIYIRSEGRVQFFALSPSLQVTLAGLTLIFLGWVGFATVNVVFKDRIIAAKDHRYQQMQATYESRVTDLQASYDELNGALAGAQDRFKATADALQAKQNAISGFLNRADQARTMARAETSAPPTEAANGMGATNGIDLDSDSDGATALTVMPGPAAPQPRTARIVKAGMLDGAIKTMGNWFAQLGARLHIARYRPAPQTTAAAYALYPGLRALAEQTARVARIDQNETALMTRTEGALDQGVNTLRAVVRRTGINPDSFTRKLAMAQGVGGPEIPLDQVRIEGINDTRFTQAYLKAAAVMSQMNGLSAAIDHMPLDMPVSAANFDKSSGFGPRIDPFTGRYAFHPGVDFAGAWGSVVHATAPGTVVFAGYRGGYGNMIEIDHGNGIHTRYGHLSSISVRVGAKVGKGAAIGHVGSTGRSTGPHVHYEVWYDDTLKNPSNFIAAGRHVL